MHLNNKPRLIQTYLIDGTLEGIRIIDCETTVHAIVVPRVKLADAKLLNEALRPALYFLINSNGDKAYIGEAENFYNRVKNHDQNKDWWDVAVAIVSTTNELSKGDVRYLESLAVERAQNGSIEVENKVSPVLNNVSRFSVHKLQNILDDTELLLTSLNYDVLAAKQELNTDNIWYLFHKGIEAKAEYRGSQFVVLAGSEMHLEETSQWARDFPRMKIIRDELLEKKTKLHKDKATLQENTAFKSVSMAAGMIIGRHVNGWTAWRNKDDKTMDEVMRQGD